MEECEICGRKANEIYIVSVEEVELRVCAKCARGKKVISKVVEQQSAQKQAIRERKTDYEQLVENYGALIQRARASMKLPLKVLAEMLNEKETLLLRIEQQRSLPSEELRKKLERVLGIRLIESAQAVSDSADTASGRNEKATLGDFLNG